MSLVQSSRRNALENAADEVNKEQSIRAIVKIGRAAILDHFQPANKQMNLLRSALKLESKELEFKADQIISDAFDFKKSTIYSTLWYFSSNDCSSDEATKIEKKLKQRFNR